MNENEWWDEYDRHTLLLEELAAGFHPWAGNPPLPPDKITAAAAEAACEHVRGLIRQDAEKEDPVSKMRKLRSGRDLGGMMSFLNQIWFGIPESRPLPYGFNELCGLLEDPPEPA